MIGALFRNLRLLAAGLTIVVAAMNGTASAQDSMPVRDLARLTHIHGLAVDPLDPSPLYVATHHGLYAATESGQATRVSLTTDDFMGFTPNPGDPTALYAS